MLYALALRAILSLKGLESSPDPSVWEYVVAVRSPSHPPPPHSVSTPHGAHLAGAAPLTILPNHHLGGVQSVLMLSQQLPKCNNYSFFFFSSNVQWQSGVGEWWWKRGCTVRVREYPAIWQRKHTHNEAWDKSKWFLKTLLWVSRDAALIFSVSLSLSLCALRSWIFLISNRCFSCYFTLTLLPYAIVSLTRERKASSCLFTRSADKGIISQWA